MYTWYKKPLSFIHIFKCTKVKNFSSLFYDPEFSFVYNNYRDNYKTSLNLNILKSNINLKVSILETQNKSINFLWQIWTINIFFFYEYFNES